MVEYNGRIAPWDLLLKAIPDCDLGDFLFGVDVGMMFKADPKDPTNSKARRYLRGVASTPDKDLQEEEVLQKGLDLRYYLKHGYLNDDHKPGPEHKVGRPTRALIKMVVDANGKDVLGFWNEGYMWPEGYHPGADAIWRLGKALEAADDEHRLGFSIQGKVLKRESKKILRAWIQDVAVTASPVNTATWLEFCEDLGKSHWATTEDVASIKKGLDARRLVEDPVVVGEPWEERRVTGVREGIGKALSASSIRALSPESLDEREKVLPRKGIQDLITEQMDESLRGDVVTKTINAAYREFRTRGYKEGMARAAALVVASRQLLA